LAGQRVAQLPGDEAEILVFTGLEPDTPYTLTIIASDPALVRTTVRETLRTAPVLATLSISEVYADAAGPEPAQEFVELLNFGTEAVALHKVRLSDSTQELGTPIASELRLAPGARALLVSDSYNPGYAGDPAPAAGTPLVRIGKALTRSGLANAGENLFLRDGEGRRLSGAPAFPAPRPGRCSVRHNGVDPRSLAIGSFELAPDGSCTPGF
ncbi:MAG: hypothetical protein RL701_6961, partial [Pseudomonadota bacterium]